MEYALVNVFGEVKDIYPTREEAIAGNRKYWGGLLDVRAIWTREIWGGGWHAVRNHHRGE